MHPLKITLLVLLGSLEISCRPTTESPLSGKKVDIYPFKSGFNLEQNVSLKHLIDSVRYIQLVTTPECLIVGVGKVFFIDQKIAVWDVERGKIFIFDSTGRYLTKIDNQSSGPNEYVLMNVVTEDHATQNLIAQCFPPANCCSTIWRANVPGCSPISVTER